MAKTNLKASDSMVDSPAGCVVVLEPGARWPEQAFARVTDRDGVAVVHESPEETPEHFFKRLARQLGQVAASGVRIRTVLVACAVAGSVSSIDRGLLAVQVQRHASFAPNGTVIFVDGDTAHWL